MKALLAFVVSFVVATAASATTKLALAKPPARALASADAALKAGAGDSGETDSAAASGQAPTSLVDTLRPPELPRDRATPDSAKAAGPNAFTGNPVAPAAPAAPAASHALAAPDSATELSERRIAKVFASMDAKQAATVLEHMTDADVDVILDYAGLRQAASIMAALPPERAAALSKLAIKRAQSGRP